MFTHLFVDHVLTKVKEHMANAAVYGGATTSVLGTWLGVVQPIVAIIAGVAAAALAFTQLYFLIKNNGKKG